MKKLLFLLVSVVCFFSCTKETTADYPNPTNKKLVRTTDPKDKVANALPLLTMFLQKNQVLYLNAL